jgi:hypothetical protein
MKLKSPKKRSAGKKKVRRQAILRGGDADPRDPYANCDGEIDDEIGLHEIEPGHGIRLNIARENQTPYYKCYDVNTLSQWLDKQKIFPSTSVPLSNSQLKQVYDRVHALRYNMLKNMLNNKLCVRMQLPPYIASRCSKYLLENINKNLPFYINNEKKDMIGIGHLLYQCFSKALADDYTVTDPAMIYRTFSIEVNYNLSNTAPQMPYLEAILRIKLKPLSVSDNQVSEKGNKVRAAYNRVYELCKVFFPVPSAEPNPNEIIPSFYYLDVFRNNSEMKDIEKKCYGILVNALKQYTYDNFNDVRHHL